MNFSGCFIFSLFFFTNVAPSWAHLGLKVAPAPSPKAAVPKSAPIPHSAPVPSHVGVPPGSLKATVPKSAPSLHVGSQPLHAPLPSPQILNLSSPPPLKPSKHRKLLQSGVDMIFDGGQADHLDVQGNSVSIRIDSTGTARAKSARSYPLGTTFTAQVKCPDGDLSGIVTGFYLSSDEGDRAMDEVDFEFVANDKSRVQTNYFTSGVGQHEQYLDLGADCSAGFTTYTIVYGETTQFIIGGKVVREASGFSKNVYLYVIGWWGGDPYWVGTTTWANAPYYFKVSGITIS